MLTRRQILGRIAVAPVWLARFALAAAWMLATTPLLLLAVFGVVLPAMLGWIVSPPVGLVSPAAGHRLMLHCERACDLLERLIDVAWTPVDWLLPT